MLTNTDLRIRVKIPIDAGLCVTCGEPRLSTDGKRVVCACGAETDVSQHGKGVRKFARQVRAKLRPGRRRKAV